MGGDTERELASTEQQLTRSVLIITMMMTMMTRSVLRLMVCPAMEEDEGEGGGEEKYDFNLEYISNIGDIMVNFI